MMGTLQNSRPTKRRVEYRGLPVNVEIEAGERRAGVGEDGAPWAHVYANAYGEIDGTVGADGDPVDCYLGPAAWADLVYVVRQNHLTGSFDEDKVFLGFPDAASAEKAYRAHGPACGFGGLEAVPFDDFVRDYVAAPHYPANVLGGTP